MGAVMPSRKHLPRLLLVIVPCISLVLAATPALAAFPITEYPVLTANAIPNFATLGPDGNVWFTEFSADKIGKITTAGVVTEYPIPTADSQPEGITAGPDGNLWFVETAANQVGKINTAGKITEFSIPTANSGAAGITAGPDGKLWFTEFAADRIGRITTSGVFSSFKVPTGNSGPNGITTGSNGNLWFTEYKANKVGEVTTSGTFTEFPVAAGHPYAIAPGSDGNLWFTESGLNDINRMTTAGAVTGTFSVPTSPGVPFGIAPGPDKNLWFTEYQGNNVTQITTAGTMTESPVPTAHAKPFGITPGSDGNVWFAENGGNNIGTIRLPNLRIHYIFYIPNRFFIPNITLLPTQGDTVSWLMLNPGIHGIADASGMGLFQTPNGVPIGETFQFSFTGAGSYAYDDPFNTAAKGTVKVPIVVTPVVGAVDTAQVTWASADPPAGFAFDVQVKRPGTSSFVPWRTGVTSLTATFGPSDPLWAGTGTYRFRARMRNLANGKASGYSNAKAITLS
jgi:streptogramin lyase